jgi:CheY-like chemotaxis protein
MKEKTILLADDDIDDREMFCEALERIDKTIACNCSINGIELLKKLDVLDEIPQLVFLDLNMPVMNGWQCLQLLKKHEHHKDIPVIIISTAAHNDEMNMAIERGALCYLVKPNNFKELSNLLEKIVANLGPGLRDGIQQLQAAKPKYIYAARQ